jgi:hypothetical protein
VITSIGRLLGNAKSLLDGVRTSGQVNSAFSCNIAGTAAAFAQNQGVTRRSSTLASDSTAVGTASVGPAISVAANAFVVTGNVDMNQQDTSAAFFVGGHYLAVTSTWNDGPTASRPCRVVGTQGNQSLAGPLRQLLCIRI